MKTTIMNKQKSDERDIPLIKIEPTVQVFQYTKQNGQFYLVGQGKLNIVMQDKDDKTQSFIEVTGSGQLGTFFRSKIQSKCQYEIQKQTIIAWHDPQRIPQDNQVGLSFERAQQCDFYWYVPLQQLRRLICEKINRNYLTITGEVLEMPNQKNLQMILEKAREKRDVIEYHLLNSKQFVNKLFQIYINSRNGKNVKAIYLLDTIFNTVLQNVDHSTILALLKQPVFSFILMLKKSINNIDYIQAYEERQRFRHMFPISQEVVQKVKVTKRILFFRQKMLHYIKNQFLQTTLIIAYNDCIRTIVNGMCKKDFIQKIINAKQLFNISKYRKQKKILKKTISQSQKMLTESQILDTDRQSKVQQNNSMSDIDPETQKALQSISKNCLQQSLKMVTIESPKLRSMDSEVLQLTTDEAEIGAMKLKLFMQTLVMAKQTQRTNLRLIVVERFLESGVLQLITRLLDLLPEQSLSLLLLITKCNNEKIMDYLKLKFRQTSAQNLLMKLAKRYSVYHDVAIVDWIKYLSDTLRQKQHLDFLLGTFFAYIFNTCNSAKAITLLLSQVQDVLSNVEPLYQQVVKSKLLQKLVSFLRSCHQDKHTKLRAMKILKVLIIDNAYCRELRKQYLAKLNQELFNSGLFQYCMTILEQNIKFNNILSSAMLENIKIIGIMTFFSPFHKQIRDNYSKRQIYPTKIFAKILSFKQTKPQIKQKLQQPEKHQKQLEQQKQQDYFLKDNLLQTPLTGQNRQVNQEQMFLDIQNIRKIRQQLNQQQRKKEDKLIFQTRQSKRIKLNEELQQNTIKPIISFQFKLEFEEQPQKSSEV